MKLHITTLMSFRGVVVVTVSENLMLCGCASSTKNPVAASSTDEVFSRFTKLQGARAKLNNKG